MISHSFQEELIFVIAIGLTLSVALAWLVQTKLKVNAEVNNTMQAEIKQRVLVVENKLLLGAGLEMLLQQNDNLEVIGISPGNEEELIREIRYFNPSVIIIDETTYLTHTLRLLALLRKFHELRLVIVSANDNLIHIYHKHNLLLTKPADLINIVLQNYSQMYWERGE